MDSSKRTHQQQLVDLLQAQSIDELLSIYNNNKQKKQFLSFLKTMLSKCPRSWEATTTNISRSIFQLLSGLRFAWMKNQIQSSDVTIWMLFDIIAVFPNQQYVAQFVKDLLQHVIPVIVQSSWYQIAGIPWIHALENQQDPSLLLDSVQTLANVSVISLPLLYATFDIESSSLERTLRPSGLFGALLRLYEVRLPHIIMTNNTKDTAMRIRSAILQIIYQWLHNEFLKPSIVNIDYDACFTAINDLAYMTCSDNNAQGGSFLSDFNRLYDLRKCLGQKSCDTSRVEYLDMVFSNLPTRNEEERNEDTPPPPCIMTQQKYLNQLSEMFPDFNESQLLKCLKAQNYDVDRTVNCIFEGSVEPIIEENPEAKVASDIVGVEDDDFEFLSDLPASSIWLGKKRIAKKYDPESVKNDTEFEKTQREIMMSYEDEDDSDDDNEILLTVKEYDDDYDDEFDDFVPFGVNDSRLNDFDTIRAQNEVIKQKEAEDNFWESMRNQNRKPSKSDTSDSESTNTNNTIEKPQSTKSRKFKNKNKAKIGNHHRKDRAAAKKRG